MKHWVYESLLVWFILTKKINSISYIASEKITAQHSITDCLTEDEQRKRIIEQLCFQKSYLNNFSASFAILCEVSFVSKQNKFFWYFQVIFYSQQSKCIKFCICQLVNFLVKTENKGLNNYLTLIERYNCPHGDKTVHLLSF